MLDCTCIHNLLVLVSYLSAGVFFHELAVIRANKKRIIQEYFNWVSIRTRGTSPCLIILSNYYSFRKEEVYVESIDGVNLLWRK